MFVGKHNKAKLQIYLLMSWQLLLLLLSKINIQLHCFKQLILDTIFFKQLKVV